MYMRHFDYIKIKVLIRSLEYITNICRSYERFKFVLDKVNKKILRYRSKRYNFVRIRDNDSPATFRTGLQPSLLE